MDLNFKVSNSLQERLKRVKTGKDNSNWLTEDLPTQTNGGFGVPVAGRSQEKPDEKKVKQSLGALNDVYKSGVGDLKDEWDGVKPGTPESQELAKNYAGRSILFAQDLSRRMHDPDNDELDDPGGAGGKQLSYQEIQALKANEKRNIRGFGDGSPQQTQDLVRSSRPFQFSPKFVETTWNVIRGALGKTEAFRKSGGLSAGNREAGMTPGGKLYDSFFYADENEEFPTYHEPKTSDKDYEMEGRGRNRAFKLDENGEKILKPNSPMARYLKFKSQLESGSLGKEFRGSGSDGEARARIMWKLFLEQGGRDALTQLSLDPRSMILEHTTPFNRSSGMNDKLNFPIDETDTDSNWVLLNAAVNEAKSGGTMEEMYGGKDGKGGVRRFYGVQPEDYDQSEEKRVAAREYSGNWLNQILATMIDGEGNIIEGEHLNELKDKIEEHSERIESIRTDILGLYDKKDVVGSKPKKLTAKQQRDPKQLEAYDNALREYEAKLEAFDPGRMEYVRNRAGSVGGLKNAWKGKLFSGLGISKTWSRVGGGTGTPEDLRQLFLDKIIENPKKIPQLRKRWNDAVSSTSKFVKNMETYRGENKDKGEKHFKEKFGDLTGVQHFRDLVDGMFDD